MSRSSSPLTPLVSLQLLPLLAACGLMSCTRNPPAPTPTKTAAASASPDPLVAGADVDPSAPATTGDAPAAIADAPPDTPPVMPPPELEPLDVAHPTPRFLIKVPQRALNEAPVFFSPDGRHIGVDGEECDVWEIESGHFAGTISIDYCEAAWNGNYDTRRISRDGAWVVDIKAGTPFVTISAQEDPPPYSLELEDDEEEDVDEGDTKKPAAGAAKKPPEDRRLGGCEGDCGPADAVAWSDDGAMIAIGRSSERTIELWQVAANKKVATLTIPESLDLADPWLAWGPDAVVALGEEPLDGEDDEEEDEDDEDYEEDYDEPSGPQPTVYTWDPDMPEKPDRDQHAVARLDTARLDPLGRHLYLVSHGSGRVMSAEMQVINVGGGPISQLELEDEDEEDPFEAERYETAIDDPWRGGPDLQHVTTTTITEYDGEETSFEYTVIYLDPTAPLATGTLDGEPDEFEYRRGDGTNHAFTAELCVAPDDAEEDDEEMSCQRWLAPPDDCELRAVSADLKWAIGTCKDDEVARRWALSNDARTLQEGTRIQLGDRWPMEMGFGTGSWLWTTDTDDLLLIRDNETLSRLYRSRGKASLVPGTLHFDRGVIAIQYEDGVHFVDTSTWKRRFKVDGAAASYVALHPHEERAALIFKHEDKNTIAVLDLTAGAVRKRWTLEDEDDHIAWRDDGSALISGVISPANAWNPETGERVTPLPLAVDPFDAIEEYDSFDPTWRFGALGPSTLLRVSDGVELDLEDQVTRDGFFAGPRDKVPFGVFRLGPDVLRGPLVTSESLVNILHHPTLVSDFLAGKPIVDARVFRPLAPPPTLSLSQDPATGAWTVSVALRDVDERVGMAARTVTTMVRAGILPLGRWTEKTTDGTIDARHEFTSPAGPKAPFTVEACTADGLCTRVEKR